MYINLKVMRIITTAEFRKNQKTYFDLSEKERVIITRDKNRKPILLTPLSDEEETEVYFSDPKILKSIQEGIKDIQEGRVTTIKDPKNIWQDIL